MKNEKAFKLLNSLIFENNLLAKGGVKTRWGHMALKDTPNAKFKIEDKDKVRQVFHPYIGKFNVWFQTSSKYITVYMEDLDNDRYALMSIANSRSLHIA